MSQSALLRTRRFFPLFVTQFLGAFNDNVYKYALVILITFRLASAEDGNASLLVIIAGGIFILPFFLFSAIAGQFADKYEKSRLIRRIKIAELLIMMCGAVGFYTGNIIWLMCVLFLMGTQSTLFGPLKYSIVPQHMELDELTGANGLLQMGTFVAILAGTVLGGMLVAEADADMLYISSTVILLAMLGIAASIKIPEASPSDPGLQLRWNIFSETLRIIHFARIDARIFLSVLAISWFWLFGATLLSLFPSFGKDILGGDAGVVILLQMMFTVGIGLGALSCEHFSSSRIELGLVPIGALGISLFTLDLYFASHGLEVVELQALATWLETAGHWRILLDLVMLSFCGGFYIVPLYAHLQAESDVRYRSRIIAALNVLNALFMVLSALMTSLMVLLGLSVTEIFAVIALLNVCVLMILFRHGFWQHFRLYTSRSK